MAKRTDKEIQEQIDGLKAIKDKPSFRRTTMFGDDNVAAIEAQIEVLERKFSVDTVDNRCDPDDPDGSEWTEHVHNSAYDAATWLAGESDDKPVDGWEGLH